MIFLLVSMMIIDERKAIFIGLFVLVGGLVKLGLIGAMARFLPDRKPQGSPRGGESAYLWLRYFAGR